MCKNTLHTVEYTLRHDGAGSITAVEAAVVLTSVTAHDDDGGALTQRYSVAFVESGAVGVRSLSGGAGYLPSARVLAGVKAKSAPTPSSASWLKDGLPLPAAAGASGVCAVDSHTPVRFGTDQVSACTIALTAAQLQGFCEGTEAVRLEGGDGEEDVSSSAWAPLPVRLLKGLMWGGGEAGAELPHAGDRVFVGAWANVDVEAVDEWLDLEVRVLPRLDCLLLPNTIPNHGGDGQGFFIVNPFSGEHVRVEL